MEQSAPLTIFKASAGSGKTFTLAVEYIKLLILNPEAYRNILAVTFTNKATDEMKMRILSQLYGLSRGLPDSKSYFDEIIKDLKLQPEYIRSQAGKAMTNLLHNYHYFRVQTIDAFFQTVLKNLARELQLNANLRVGLDQKQVVQQAVDEIIDSLADNKLLMSVVMEYIHDNIEADKSWDVINSIKSFGENIYSEVYKQNRDKLDNVLGNQAELARFKQQLSDIVKSTKEKYAGIGRKALKALEDAGYKTSDFKYGAAGVPNYFNKLIAGNISDDIVSARVQAGIKDPKTWVKAGEDAKLNLVISVLQPLLKESETSRSYEARQCLSAQVILKHINNLRLLKTIEDTTKLQNEEAQRFMLSDTQTFLREMIGEDDSPFIFEKIGAHLEHIMIDEFQDTSTVQWANFKTLLNECMSHEAPHHEDQQVSQNIIVGDVKQSIYRFRSGDWRLLNNIKQEFREDQILFNPRPTNYRSSHNIVTFNNTFFAQASVIEQNAISHLSSSVEADAWRAQLDVAYKDVEQKLPDDKLKQPPVGLVHIKLFAKPAKKKNGDNGGDASTIQPANIPEETLNTIRDLVDRGEKVSDIAILARNGNEIQTLAKYIEENSDFRVISNEAFQLISSPAVRVIINAMKVLASPKDDISLATLLKDYHQGILHKTSDDATLYGGNKSDMLPKEFNDGRHRLLALPLPDMAERLIDIFSINGNADNEAAYINRFMDLLNDFCNNNTPILEDFLKNWDTDIYKKTIQSSDTNGIRLFTIHKSKGLEFRHVILPYCDWRLFPPTGSTLWVKPEVMPFSEVKVLPVTYYSGNSFKGTIFEKDGLDETVQIHVDNLNLLYVAMTRAGHSLFMFGMRDNNPETMRDGLIQTVINNLPDNIGGVPVHISGKDNDKENLELTFGTLADNEKKAKEASKNVFTPQNTPVTIGIRSYDSKGKYRQSNDSRRFADDCFDESDRRRMVHLGTVMHQLFATIRTTADIEPAIQRMEFDGTLYDSTLTKDTLLDTLREKFSDPQVKDWFSDRWTVYNERSIIIPGGGEQRPDRVITDGHETIVIDFKFGNNHPEYHEQVSRYMALLEEMGMPNVSGYLWFVNKNNIIKV